MLAAVQHPDDEQHARGTPTSSAQRRAGAACALSELPIGRRPGALWNACADYDVPTPYRRRRRGARFSIAAWSLPPPPAALARRSPVAPAPGAPQAAAADATAA